MRLSKMFSLRSIAGFALVAMTCLSSQILNAATIAVTTTTDELNNTGDGCSLREAIQSINNGANYNECANSSGDAYGTNDTINIPAGTYLIAINGPCENLNATGDFDILKNISIIGAGAGSTIIDGNGLDRIFHIVGATITTNISNLTVRNGLTNTCAQGLTDFGGGIRNDNANLTIVDVIVSGNSAISGGGIANFKNLNVQWSTINSNTATVAGGTGIGGGIYNGVNTTNTIINSTISGNNTDTNGGGINICAAGAAATLNLRNVTLTGNSAANGGGISSCTADTAYKFHIYIRNSIIARNTATTVNPDCFDRGNLVFHSQEYNLIGDNSGCATQPWAATDQVGDVAGGGAAIDPLIDALAANGGETPTHALRTSPTVSPALDKANPAGCFGDDAQTVALTEDQRRELRPANGLGGATAVCDIGAYEYQPICGDNIVQPPEECDNGANNSDTQADACRTTCKLAFCGDNVVDTGEECDDGANNGAAGDTCSLNCRSVPLAGFQLSGDSPWNCTLNPSAAGSMAPISWLLISLAGILFARYRRK